MTWSLIAAAAWVFAATGTALLPMRYQYLPGSLLLLTAPALIAWLWIDLGWVVGACAVLGLLSMFRRPLIHLAARALGRRPQNTEDPR